MKQANLRWDKLASKIRFKDSMGNFDYLSHPLCLEVTNSVLLSKTCVFISLSKEELVSGREFAIAATGRSEISWGDVAGWGSAIVAGGSLGCQANGDTVRVVGRHSADGVSDWGNKAFTRVPIMCNKSWLLARCCSVTALNWRSSASCCILIKCSNTAFSSSRRFWSASSICLFCCI